jgi:hypothetical protein
LYVLRAGQMLLRYSAQRATWSDGNCDTSPNQAGILDLILSPIECEIVVVFEALYSSIKAKNNPTSEGTNLQWHSNYLSLESQWSLQGIAMYRMRPLLRQNMRNIVYSKSLLLGKKLYVINKRIHLGAPRLN